MEGRKVFITKPKFTRTQISEILLPDGKVIFLGGHNVLSRYGEHQINHIVSMIETEKLEGVEHDIYPVKDNGDLETVERLGEILKELLPKIHASLEAGNRVCVHCLAGVSRSATVVAAYLVRYHKVLDPVSYLREYRPCVNPNYGFVSLLQ